MPNNAVHCPAAILSLPPRCGNLRVRTGQLCSGIKGQSKGNQPKTENGVKDFFECIAENSRSRYETFDKEHGRIERRIYTPDTNIGRFTGKKERKNLAALGMCERTTKRKDKKVSEKRYFITGLKDAEQFAKAVRNHRAIENNLQR